MSEELHALAVQTQIAHQALIDQASRVTSTEARREIRNQLDSLRQDFTEKALAVVGVPYPLLLNPSDPDQGVILAIRDSIADTENRLAALAEGEALQRFIVASRSAEAAGPTLPKGPDLKLIVIAAIIIAVAYALGPLLRSVKK